MIITEIFAQEIFDSCGFPTILCTVTLDDKIEISASVPSGTSISSFACKELRDNDERFLGKGVRNSVVTINSVINATLKGKKADVVEIDQLLLELDGTHDKSLLGSNTMIAVSLAVCRAQAFSYGIDLYELISHLNENKHISLPMPMVNMINGGMHGNANLVIQEFLVIPRKAESFVQGFEWSVTIFYALQKLLQEKNIFYAFGKEGGFVIDVAKEEDALDLLCCAIEKTVGLDNIQLALDCAASHWYDRTNKLYTLHGQQLLTEEVIDWYKGLCKNYPISLLEDPLSEHDVDGWKTMNVQIENVYIIGDDIFATSAERIWQYTQENVAHGAIIKPNQIGTITQMLQAVQVCQENELLFIPSHRSGETNDPFIADIAVGTGAHLTKIGGPTCGERIAKYNRLLVIEKSLRQ